jgi:hypothetical protein
MIEDIGDNLGDVTPLQISQNHYEQEDITAKNILQEMPSNIKKGETTKQQTDQSSFLFNFNSLENEESSQKLRPEEVVSGL